MIKYAFKIILTAYSLILLSTAILYAQNRTEPRRIHSKEEHDNYLGANYWSSSTSIFNYYYNFDQPELIDSIVINSENSDIDTTATHTTVHAYESSSNFEDGFYYYHYLSNSGSSFHLVKDRNHRLISNTISPVTGNAYQYYRYYNQNGRLDSLTLTIFTESGQDNKVYHFLYDNMSNMYPNSIQDVYISGGTILETHLYPITYPTDLPLNPVYLNWDELVLSGEDYNSLSMFIHPMYQVQSYSINGYNYIINYSAVNNQYQISWDDEQTKYGFDQYGYLVYKSVTTIGFDTYSSQNNTTNYNWETFTPVTNNVSDIIITYLTAYPNPFKSSLNIKLTGKDKAPSDISIYNIKGQLIRSWKDNKATELSWDGRDNHNLPVSNGVYLIKAKLGRLTSNMKIIKL